MKSFPDIVIWDTDAARINAADLNLRQALKRFGLSASISSMSEPPLIGRAGLTGKVPVLEIENKFWSLPPGKPITEEDCVILIQRIRGIGRAVLP